MNSDSTEKFQKETGKKSSRRKVIVTVIILPVLLIFLLVLFLSKLESVYPQVGAEVIRKEAAIIIGVEPNELNDEDFEKIEVLNLSRKTICDIKLLEKFTNLKELNLSFLAVPKTKKPKWMTLLAKFNIYNSSQSKVIDLSPLKNLTNLRKLELRMTAVKNIKPLARLKNLEILKI